MTSFPCLAAGLTPGAGPARFVVASPSMARRTVQLRVGGQTYRVVTSASDEELQRLAAVVDAKLASVVPVGRAVSPQAMLLAAMALAHDLEEERAKTAQVAGRAKDAFGRILQRVDAVLAAGSPSNPALPDPSGGANDGGL